MTDILDPILFRHYQPIREKSDAITNQSVRFLSEQFIKTCFQIPKELETQYQDLMNYEKINQECWKELRDNLLKYAEYEKLMFTFIHHFCEDLYYIYLEQERKTN